MIDVLGCREQGETALIIGKFWPFHKGHEYLISYACATMGDNPVDVLACQNPDREVFSVAKRVEAILAFTIRENLLEQVSVMSHEGVDPQDPSECSTEKEFWDIWRNIISKHGPDPGNSSKKYDFVFSSEEYGWRLAKEIGAIHIPVNPARSVYNISGTKIRNDFRKNWNSLSEGMKPFLQKIVYVTGPESCGKTTLAQQLAEEYDSAYVPEYGRDYFEFQKYKELICTKEDLLQILQGHRNSIIAAIKLRTPFIFVDTDATATWLFNHFWYDEELKEALPYIDSENSLLYNSTPYYILCAPDLPWEKDPLRNLEDTRQEFFDLNAQQYHNKGKPYFITYGTGKERFDRAKAAIDKWFPPKIL